MLKQVESKLPTPPLEEAGKVAKAKRSPGKSVHRVSKRGSNSAGPSHHHSPPSPTDDTSVPHSLADGSRHKRVWKACERCRMKKTKCDGEFPCRRCKDDGLICTAGSRRKTDFKQLPPGYAEVLENTQFALVATVQKLYSMVRSGQQWDSDEPDTNDRGQPVIHSIADKLGCLRPNNDIDLPIHSVFPEDEHGVAELASQLEAQQHQEEHTLCCQAAIGSTKHDCASSDELHLPPELDDAPFARVSMTMPPNTPSLNYDMFNGYPLSAGLSSVASPMTAVSDASAVSWVPPSIVAYNTPYAQIVGTYGMSLSNQGMLEPSLGMSKPFELDGTKSYDAVRKGLGDPMICSPIGFGVDRSRQYTPS